MESYRPSAVVASDLESAKSAYGTICDRIQSLQTELGRLEIERDQYCAAAGLYRNERVGVIPRLQVELAISARNEQDEKAIRVVWSVAPRHWENDDEKIVDKVTPKRIYVRRPGHDATDIYNLSGAHEAGYKNSIIDIQATFGVPEIDAKSWLKIKADHEAKASETQPFTCLNCLEELCGLDDDPNGEHNATCAKCRAEEDHDFDAEPDAVFNRDGSMADA
jgi:hypothetical protein